MASGTELAKAYVQIIPSADGIKGKLTSVLGGEASAAGDTAGKTAGNNLASAIKKVVIAAGIGETLKKTLSEGANLQQSIGGIETLFGAGGLAMTEYAEQVGKSVADIKDEYYILLKAQNLVMNNARQAYKTAGLSANAYMETVTSFAASLKQSTASELEAAKAADQAITDMSDNVNKMGTSMELIQNAYQGFAKQNYTMLDNLKLGYGGTKTEMERLLADAQKISGVEYDIGSLSDVYEAIHVIQEEMGITGTTAKEAANTFSGSLASMKAAASNFLGNLSLGKDIKPSMDALLSSTGTFLFNNLFPMVGNILSGLVDYIVDVAVTTDWGAVITQVLATMRDALNAGVSTYFGTDTTLINDMFGFLIEGVPIVMQMIQDTFSTIWEVCNAIWTSIGQPIWDAIMVSIQYVADNWGSISETIKMYFQTVCDFWSTVWTTIGQPIWEMITFAVGSLAELFAQNMPAIMEFFQTAIAGIKDTWENHLKPVFDAIGEVLNNVVKPAFEFVWKTIIEPLVTNVFDMIKRLWEGTLKPVFDGICDFLCGMFTNDWKTAFQGILNIVTGIFNAIVVAIEKPMDLVKDIVSKAINFIKETFDFDWHLPKLKLPHFKISGSFSLSPPSVPSFGIEWYAKAMDNPVIMNKPTAFGINSLGQIMAGGEAGSEIVSGKDTLMRMIAEAVAAQNQEVINVISSVLLLLQEYLPELAHMQLVTDTGALIGELAPGMDEVLGIYATRKERGI